MMTAKLTAKQRERATALVFLAALKQAGLPDPVTEHRFHPDRRWRFDFAWPSKLVAVEIHGGLWTGGRHSGGRGQLGDMEKMNAAQMLGWRVLQYTPQQLGQALTDLAQLLRE
jgi:hypothetical protein